MLNSTTCWFAVLLHNSFSEIREDMVLVRKTEVSAGLYRLNNMRMTAIISHPSSQ